MDYDSTRKEIQWSKILTWCEVANVKTEVSAYIYDNRKSSLIDITKKTCSVLEKDWRRKSFEDFDYLMIEPSTIAWVITLILNLLLCTGLGVFFYNNEI